MNTSTTDSITKILHERAKNQLEQEIHAAFDPARKLLRDSGRIHLSVYVASATGPARIEAFSDAYALLTVLKQEAINLHLPQRQQAAVDAFVAKVDQLQTELDDIRGLVSQ